MSKYSKKSPTKFIGSESSEKSVWHVFRVPLAVFEDKERKDS